MGDILEAECEGPLSVPNAEYTIVKGWVREDGVVDGTELEYICESGYRDHRTPCLPTRLICKYGRWEGTLPNCSKFTHYRVF